MVFDSDVAFTSGLRDSWNFAKTYLQKMIRMIRFEGLVTELTIQ
jgi:hypothetical protein